MAILGLQWFRRWRADRARWLRAKIDAHAPDERA
jgi:hypothetical protein